MDTQVVQEVNFLFDDLKTFFETQKMLFGDEIYFSDTREEKPQVSVISKRDELKKLYFASQKCQACGLSKTRIKSVFGSGNPESEIMVIIDTPEMKDTQHGKPFMGEAGTLLDNILKAIHLSRSEIFLTTLVKCCPQNNRPVTTQEISACLPMLRQQIEIIQPKYILIMGELSAKIMLQKEDSFLSLRSKIYELFNAKCVITYHPNRLIKEPSLKKQTWEDVQIFQKLIQ